MTQKPKKPASPKIEMLDATSLIPYVNNAKQHDDAQVQKLAGSIRQFGFTNPILVDGQNPPTVIAGHGRLMAAQKLGMDKVPCIRLDHLSDTERRAYTLADNRLAEIGGGWDEETLKIELSALMDADIDLDALGFGDDFEFTLEDEPEQSDVDAEPQIDKAEELREKWGVETGQLWELGDHRIFCGDATNAEDVARVLAGDKPLLMVTDPPYGVEYDPEWRNRAARNSPGMGNRCIGAGAVGIVHNDDRADWREAWQLFPGDVVYVWHGGIKTALVQESLETCGFIARAQIIWAKQHMAIGRGDYHWQHEPCWYAVRDGGKGHRNDDRTQTTLWQIDKPQKSETGHSTQKPVECMARPIRNHESEFVYEPFSGSGTTIIACEQLGRKCRAIEISPGYVAVAIQRWADATGKEPKRL